MDAAQHIWISELLSSTFIQTDDSPSAIRTPNGQLIQRIRIYGILVSTGELVVDDGTGSMIIRSFDNATTATLGDPVIVIGKPRMYNDQFYVVGDIVKKIDPLWIDIARKQRPQPAIPQQETHTQDPISIVKTLDNGEGADYDQVVTKLGNNGEETITHLLAMGELFETKPGKLKVLE